jgi:nitrite reductase (NADH) small subunit
MSLTELTTTTAPVRAHTVGRVEDVPPGEGRAFVAGGVQVAVFRLRDGSLHATQAACPHAGGPLADGFIGNGKVVCPFHAYRFDLATGCPDGNACAPLATYPAGVTRDGDVIVTLGGR